MISDIHKKVAQARGMSKLDHNASIMSNNTFEIGLVDQLSQEKPARTNLRAMHNSS